MSNPFAVPVEDIQSIIDYFKGKFNLVVKQVLQKAVNVFNYFLQFLPDNANPTNLSPNSAFPESGLTLLEDYVKAVKSDDFQVKSMPSWLLPSLIEIVKVMINKLL